MKLMLIEKKILYINYGEENVNTIFILCELKMLYIYINKYKRRIIYIQKDIYIKKTK